MGNDIQQKVPSQNQNQEQNILKALCILSNFSIIVTALHLQ